MKQATSDSFWKSFLDGDTPEPDVAPPSAIGFNCETIFWAMNNLPAREAVKHLLVCGTVGSGKTKSIQLSSSDN